LSTLFVHQKAQQVHLATGVYSLVSQNSGNSEIYNCYQILLLGILATLIFN